MLLLKESIIHEIEINKSRFICYLSYASTQKEAKDFVLSIKKQNYDATHNCSAYIVGDHGEYGGSSDDGEPSKTAGSPMLEVLRKKEVTNIVAVVTRYYGGIKLGAGGLIRAYSKSVSDALKLANLIPYIIYSTLEIRCSYSYHADIEAVLKDYNVLDKLFDDAVTITLEVEQANQDNLIDTIHHISRGNAIVNIIKK
jgi:uncharacterized YigZ family protein